MAETQAPLLTAKVDAFFALLGAIEEADAKVTDLKKQRDRLELEILETLEAQGITQVKDTAGRMVYLKEPMFYGSIVKDKEKEATAFIKRSWKASYLFKESVSSSALGRVIKERLAKGLPVPEEFVTYYAKRGVGHRSAKGASDKD